MFTLQKDIFRRFIILTSVMCDNDFYCPCPANILSSFIHLLEMLISNSEYFGTAANSQMTTYPYSGKFGISFNTILQLKNICKNA